MFPVDSEVARQLQATHTTQASRSRWHHPHRQQHFFRGQETGYLQQMSHMNAACEICKYGAHLPGGHTSRTSEAASQGFSQLSWLMSPHLWPEAPLVLLAQKNNWSPSEDCSVTKSPHPFHWETEGFHQWPQEAQFEDENQNQQTWFSQRETLLRANNHNSGGSVLSLKSHWTSGLALRTRGWTCTPHLSIRLGSYHAENMVLSVVCSKEARSLMQILLMTDSYCFVKENLEFSHFDGKLLKGTTYALVVLNPWGRMNIFLKNFGLIHAFSPYSQCL